MQGRKNFLEKFAQAVHENPERTAVVFTQERLSYAQLDARSDAVASALCKRGIGRDDIVPILLQRGVGAVVSMVGVLKAGAAFCIVNPEYPKERIAFIRKDTSAKCVLDEDLLLRAADRERFTPPRRRDEDLAIVVYTSGSTGKPKGVLNTWKALTLALQENETKILPQDVYLSIAPFSFVAGAVEVLTLLCRGVPLHIATEDLRRDVDRMIAYIRQNKITCSFLPPQILPMFLAKEDGLLRLIFTGSEKLRRVYSEKSTIYNVYGASETCSGVCRFRVDRPYDSTPIGSPGRGSRVYLLDDALKEVPRGELGEICLCGQVAKGYLNLPELTEQRFVKNPFATGEDDAVLYRTGDLGRMREDGVLEYVQRKDWMIKVRGFRVEPGEIEAAIVTRSAATAAAATGFINASGQTSIYAAYTAEESLPAEEVREAIRRFLPEYMMPAFMEQIEKMPLNQNGKLDRTQLVPPDAERCKAAYIPPANQREEEVCAAFAEVLDLDGVGALDDFLLLGGDSIAAVRLQEALPGLAVDDILTRRTPRALAALKGRGTQLEKAEEREEWPLTSAERQMMAEQALRKGSIAYNVGFALQLEGSLDLARLQWALQGLVRRHRILRSYYPMKDGEFTHKIVKELPVELKREACASGEVENRIEALNRPYDVTQTPLFRFVLFETGANRAVFYAGFHHSLIDGVGSGVFLEELWRLYEGDRLPALNRDFLDWAVWQSQNPPGEGQKQFFLDMFGDGLPENEMPTRPNRPDVLPYVDTTLHCSVSAALVDEAAKRHGVTSYTLLFAVAGLVLGKYCAAEDVVLGAAMNGRVMAETGSMLGMFVNSLPIRLKPEGTKTFGEYLLEVDTVLAGVKKNQSYPFEKIVRDLDVRRSTSRYPVFDVLLNYLNVGQMPKVQGLKLKHLPLRGQALAMDLQLEMAHSGEEVRFELSYSQKLYKPQVVENLLEQLKESLERVCRDSGGMLLMDAAELPKEQRRRILEDFAGRSEEVDLSQSVVGQFRKQAKRDPQRLAVCSGETMLRYGLLDERTDRLACALAERGIGKRGRVGVIVGRSEMMPLCTLGVLKSGAGYLPLDPSYPPERLAYMLEDAAAGLLIADRGLEERIPGFGGQILYTDELDHLPKAGRLPGEPEKDDLLVLLYTSGTTGKPKGVMLSHGNLVHFCHWYNRFYQAGAEDAVAAYASFGFDACLMDMYPALVRGAAVHIIPQEMRLDLERINTYFNQNKVRMVFMTTQLGRQFAEGMSKDNHSLKELSIGGEALVPLEPPENFVLYNLYGPTECTIISTAYRVESLCDRVPIGMPVDNMRGYVVDKYDRLCPVGTAGELCLAGHGIAKGYLNRPDATEEKFVPNPFTEDIGFERMYRSGDIVRYLPDGNIDFVGRHDFQVKIRGFRVELTEIEGRIRAFPPVQDAAVVPVDAPGGGKCAVAYVVAEGTLEVDALSAFIGQALPPYMIPAVTMQIEKIPLNVNGKVDRRKLPPPNFGGGEASGADVADSGMRTELEKGIAQIVEGVLGHGDFSLNTDLMRVGLSSLSAIKLATQLSKRYGVSLNAAEMVQEVSVLTLENALVDALLQGGAEQALRQAEEEMIKRERDTRQRISPSTLEETELQNEVAKITAKVLGQDSIGHSEDLMHHGLSSLSAIKLITELKRRFGVTPAVTDLLEGASVIDISQRLRQKEEEVPELTPEWEELEGYPLTGSQMGVYLDWLKRPEALVYNIPACITFPQQIEAESLARAVEILLDAHPGIRMHLVGEGEDLLQIPDDAPVKVPVLKMDDAGLQKYLRRFVQPFDLMKGPLFRVAVVETPQKLALLLDFHHIVFDGASFDLFLRELSRVYEGQAPEPEEMSAFQYALQEYKREQAGGYEKDREFFAQQLKDFEAASEIAGDLPGKEPGALQMVLCKVDRRRAEQFCRENALTPAELFLAVTGYTVSRWTYNRYVALSTISGGRGDLRLANTYGMFVHTLPVAFAMDPDESVLCYMKKAKENLRGAIAHETYPFVRIAAEFGFMPSIMYACELGVLEEYTLGGVKAEMTQLVKSDAKFKLSIHIEEHRDEYYFAVQYDSALYSQGLARRIADTLGVAFENMTQAPLAPVGGVSLVSAEQRRVLDGFAKTDAKVPCRVVHGMFEQAVDLHPEALALIAEEGQYTYAELEAQANRVANGLLARGLQPEDRVAFLLPRTGAVLKAMLGILKAGGAYIPLDPGHPEGRLRQILQDSGAKWILTAGEDARFDHSVDIAALTAGGEDVRPCVAVNPEQLAYLIYTSGSTGKPKGVMVEHHNIANYLTAHPQNRHIWALVQNAKRVMSITTVTFDMFLKESMASLCNGLTLVFAGQETAHDPVKLACLFEQTGADAFNATPSRMMEYTALPALLSALRRCSVVMAGAEKYPDALLRRLRGEDWDRPLLFNTYGPTEATVSCNAKELNGAAKVTVGAPLLNVRECVMDEDGNELPVGVTGELWIGGEGVARGYLGLEEETRKQFVEYADGRVYRSGDLARWTPQGEIEILGRRDSQVKLRGLRIELAEVESAMLAVPGVENAVAAVQKGKGEERLCVYYVAAKPLEPAAVKGELAKVLTGHMLPSAYMQMEALPKTASGKVDRKKLPLPKPLGKQEYVAPATEAEEKFCTIFAKVLELDRVGATDDFFEMGGSSLTVTRVVIEAQSQGIKGENGERISYGDVFASPSPRALAALLESGEGQMPLPKKEDEYDYHAIEAILKKNTLEAFRSEEPRKLGEVLLTGATGFLGIHVLQAMLDSAKQGKIYCLLRRGEFKSAEERLKHQLFYYFEDNYEEAFGERVIVVEGDITKPESFEKLNPLPVDTILNCAANVNHFAKDDSIYRVNTEGAKNLVAFALKKEARLVQISTSSVAGFSVDGVPARDMRMDERMLYFRQNLENQYVYSKFFAEREVLQAVATRGLDAKVMRVGNLMGRRKDGEFQMNAASNSFLGRLRTCCVTGCFPYSAYLYTTELAPIDDTALAVLQLARAPKQCVLFHPHNNYTIYLGDIIEEMRRQGLSVEFVEDDVYASALAEAMKDRAKAKYLTSIVAYQNVAGGKVSVPVPVDNRYTTEALLRLGWRWTNTGSEYLSRFLHSVIGLGYFDVP
ncbi:amino acid adenylation domain-containing protein [Ruminococcaceae bacterium OttesenSCG-928-I18]|nr:amino acid adenylation domain-containing protein [Ruminococcaceae bacterium OttesenSCG-928-I18]